MSERTTRKKLKRVLAGTKDISEHLLSDLVWSVGQLSESIAATRKGERDESDVINWTKAVIRNFFSLVEGNNFAMRRAVLAGAKSVGMNLRNEERARLEERKYNSSTDTISVKAKLVFPKEGIEIACRCFPMLYGRESRLDIGSDGWKDFLDLLQIRNGLTHPRKLEDLVPLDAGHLLGPTIQWYLRLMSASMSDCAESVGWDRFSEPDLRLAKFDLAKPDGLTYFDSRPLSEVAASVGDTRDYARHFLVLANNEILWSLGLIRSLPVAESAGMERQSCFRTLIRSIVAMLEGNYGLAKFYLSCAEEGGWGDVILTAHEKESLLRGPFLERFVAALDLFAAKVGLGNILLTSGQAWEDVCIVGQLRDRLTHPKRTGSLFITTTTQGCCINAVQWILKSLDSLEIGPDRRGKGYAMTLTPAVMCDFVMRFGALGFRCHFDGHFAILTTTGGFILTTTGGF